MGIINYRKEKDISERPKIGFGGIHTGGRTICSHCGAKDSIGGNCMSCGFLEDDAVMKDMGYGLDSLGPLKESSQNEVQKILKTENITKKFHFSEGNYECYEQSMKGGLVYELKFRYNNISYKITIDRYRVSRDGEDIKIDNIWFNNTYKKVASGYDRANTCKGLGLNFNTTKDFIMNALYAFHTQ